MYVSPKVSAEEARLSLSRKRTLKVELIYLPFYLCEVEWVGETGSRQVTVALDGLLGDNLFFVPADLNYRDSEGERVDQPVCPFVLPEPEARRIALERYRWQQLEQGLRLKQKAREGKITGVRQIYYPFWVGYFQRRGRYDFRLIDAVSAGSPGVKMRRLFLACLRCIDNT
jgi:hypothetical protein